MENYKTYKVTKNLNLTKLIRKSALLVYLSLVRVYIELPFYLKYLLTMRIGLFSVEIIFLLRRLNL